MIHYYAKIGTHLIELSSDQFSTLAFLAHDEPPQLPEQVVLVKHDDGQGFIVPGVYEALDMHKLMAMVMDPKYQSSAADFFQLHAPAIKPPPPEDLPPPKG